MPRPPFAIESTLCKRAAQQLREAADLIEEQGCLGFTLGIIERDKKILIVRGGYAETATSHALEAALRVLMDIVLTEE